MAILATDVKLLKSQRLTDEEDGGGRATGQAVADDEINNLFPDISRLDRTTGRINLRKVFAGVSTTNSDTYLGAHAIVTKAPADPRVSVLLFNTKSQTDERNEAKSSIENYLVPSTVASFDLLGDQHPGQRAIVGIQRVEQAMPETGEVYQLISGLVTQYVRVDAVEPSIEEFAYESNATFIMYTRRRVSMSISSALEFKFPGGQPLPSGTSNLNINGEKKSVVLATVVADSARYYGISKLAAAVAVGDINLTVDSVYAQLVPSAIKESALVNQVGGPRTRHVIASSTIDRTAALTFASAGTGVSRAFLTTGTVRRSVTLSINGGVYTDDGTGKLNVSGASAGFTNISIDYETGEINAYRASVFTGSASATYRPGVAATGQAITGMIEIDLASRGFAYTLNLADAKLRPGTLVISFMALGRWYDLTDTGAGVLVGEGSGSVDFATGSVSLSLNALPDVGTALLYSYIGQMADNYVVRTGSGAAPTGEIRHRLPHDGILPGSVVVTTRQGGIEKTLIDNGDGTLSGAGGSGIIYYADGNLRLSLTATQDADSTIEFAYQVGEAAALINTTLSGGPDAGGLLTGTIPGAPLKPGTVQFNWQVAQKSRTPVLSAWDRWSSDDATVTVYSGTVSLERSINDNSTGGWPGLAGSLNYTTGEFSLVVEAQYSYPEYYVGHNYKGYPQVSAAANNAQQSYSGTLRVQAMPADAVLFTESDSLGAPGLTWDLLPGIADFILPGSLLLSYAGETYVDRDGALYKGVSSSTNAGIMVGAIDYDSGLATLTSYPGGATGAITRLACLTAKTGFSTTAVMFRTPGSPLRPASTQITAVRADTAEIVTAIADLNGVVSSGIIHGNVDYQTGIVQLSFTSNPDDETGASDVPVIASLLRYNTVLQTSLPMSAELLGLDPVRLPADGRVPIYRDGDVLVIQHTSETSVASPQAGAMLQLGRDRQANIEVLDAGGLSLIAASYSADRALGQVTWANPLVLQDATGTPLTLPLVVRDRVEHMTLCTEVQISGVLGINSPLPWSLPAGSTAVSSAVTWGDLQARYLRWFAQQTWSSSNPNWSDTLIGNGTTANYNLLSYPPVITNRGAINARWALVFTSASAFNVVEEKLGVIANGDIYNDCSPMNPTGGGPYFTLRFEGWGAGWSAGNVVRFNTDSALGPLWIVRTILSGQGLVDNDQFKLQVRGDAE